MNTKVKIFQYISNLHIILKLGEYQGLLRAEKGG